MLLQFSVRNFACLAQEASFSMVASSDSSHPKHVVQSSAGRKPRVLRLGALYGANGHGKSKMIEALRFVRDLVVDGTKAGDGIDRSPFRLDPDLLGEPSRFELVIDHAGVEYSYGFAVDDERVQQEWLFARLTSRESKLFERITNQADDVTVEFGPSLAGDSKKELYSALRRVHPYPAHLYDARYASHGFETAAARRDLVSGEGPLGGF